MTHLLLTLRQLDLIASKGNIRVTSYIFVSCNVNFILYRYDPVSDSWAIVTSMKTGRDAMGVAFMGDRLFIVGGFDGQAYLNFVEAYDPLTNIWQQVNLFFYECTLLFDDLISIFFHSLLRFRLDALVHALLLSEIQFLRLSSAFTHMIFSSCDVLTSLRLSFSLSFLCYLETSL